MIFFIVAFFCGTIVYAGDYREFNQRKEDLTHVISLAITKSYTPEHGSHIYPKDPMAIEAKTRDINGGQLPIPARAKFKIVGLLVDEFKEEYDDAVNFFCDYVENKKIYLLSAAKVLDLLSDQYEKVSDYNPQYESEDEEVEPLQLIGSLLFGDLRPTSNISLKKLGTDDVFKDQDLSSQDKNL